MTDLANMLTAEPYLLQINAEAAVFGKHVVTIPPLAVADRMEILRPNIIHFDFDFGISWILSLAFLVFICLVHRNKIILVAYNIFNYRKFLTVQRLQSFPFLFSIATFGMLSIAMLFTGAWQVFDNPQETQSVAQVYFIFFGGLVLYFLSKGVVCRAIRKITQQKTLFDSVLYNQIYVFFAMCFMLMPLFFMRTLVVPSCLETLTYIQSSIFATFVLFYFVRMFIVFARENVPLFFSGLYFCTIEILPIIVIYKQFA